MAEFGLYCRPWGEKKWIDFSQYVDPKTLPEWETKIENNFYTFNLKLNEPKDLLGNILIPSCGYDFVISEDTTRMKVMGDILAGSVQVMGADVHDWGDTPADTLATFDLKIYQRNFSFDDFEINETEVKPLSYYLDKYIFAPGKTINLGGFIGGQSVSKYKMDPALDVDIPPVQKRTGINVEQFNSLLQGVGYYFGVFYLMEPDLENVINLVEYIEIFSYETGLQALPPDWQNGINRQTIKEGWFLNPKFDTVETTPNEKPYIASEIGFHYEMDATAMLTFIKVIAFIIADSGKLQRFDEFVSTSDKDTFSIGKAADILYVARPIKTKILKKLSDTQFIIDSDPASEIQIDSDRLSDNALGGYLMSLTVIDDVKYYREYTISGSTITLVAGNTETPSETGAIEALEVGMDWEHIGGYDVLREGLKSYPGENNGWVLKHVKPAEDAWFKFSNWDKPNKEKVSAFYYKVIDSHITNIYDELIRRYDMHFERQELKYNSTKEEVSGLLKALIKKTTPLEVLKFFSNRENFLPVGTKPKVDLLPFTQGYFLTTRNKCKRIAPESIYYGRALYSQEIELRTFTNSLASSLLARINNRSQASEALLEENKVHRSNFKIRLLFQDTNNVMTSALGIPVPTASNFVFDSGRLSSFRLNWAAIPGANGYAYSLLYRTAGVDHYLFRDNQIGNIITAGFDIAESFPNIPADSAFKFKIKSINTVRGIESAYSDLLEINFNTIDLSTLDSGDWAFVTVPGYGGTAQVTSNQLDLQNGVGWYNTLLPVTSFEVQFDVANLGSDGFTFTLQREGLGAVGDPAGALAVYESSDPATDGVQNSVSVEFDGFINSGWESAGGIGINTNATPTSEVQNASYGPAIRGTKITYDGITLKVYISDNAYASSVLEHEIDIPTTIGGSTAYFGFTAAAGAWRIENIKYTVPV